MSKNRHQLINRDRSSSNTVNTVNGQPQSYRSSTKKGNINVEEWLTNAKLSDYHSIFCRESITIEELLSFTDTELLSVADETLHLTVLHRKRFINAMNDTKQRTTLNRDHIYSRSSSNLLANISNNDPSPIRPSSPSLSIHSTHSSPMDSKYSIKRYNKYGLNGIEQSPLITPKYNHHHYYHRLPSIPSKSVPKLSKFNGKDNIGILFTKPRGKTHRFGRERRHSTPETEDMNNVSSKSIPNSFHGSSSNSNSSSEYVESAPSTRSIPQKNKRKGKKKKHKYKRDKTRSNSTASLINKKKKISSMVNNESKQSMTPDKRSKTYDTIQRQFKIIRTPRLAAIHVSEDEEIDSEHTSSKMHRMRLNSSDTDADNHSEDEKWHELDDNITMEEKENMKTISVLLSENKADINQIEHGIKALRNHYIECGRQIGAYFDDLQDTLKQRNIEILDILESVKRDKEKTLNKKIIRLQQHKKHVLKQKYLCDELINDDENNIQQRQEKIAELKDIALSNGSDIERDNENVDNDCLIQMEFDIKRRDFFYDNICIVRECSVPHPPYIMVKIIDNCCIALKIVIMTTKEKKVIQHDPLSNHSKNMRIEQIEMEYIQCKTNDIEQIYDEFKKLHDNDESKESEHSVSNNNKGIKRIIIDGKAKLKRIHEVILSDLLSGYYCYVRARTKSINGWSIYCEPMDTGLTIINNDLKYDIESSSHSYGIKYLSDDKCVVFDNTKEHNIAVVDMVIDKKEYDTFEWKYIIQFNEEKKKRNKKKFIMDSSDNHKMEGVCMGFISCPLDKYMKYTHAQLGRSGTQYGLFVSLSSDSASAYFTRNSSTHHTCSIKLNKKVENGDEFKILCDMKQRKCDIYYGEQLLIDVFGTKIPNVLIPGVSGYLINGSVSCSVQYISSTKAID